MIITHWIIFNFATQFQPNIIVGTVESDHKSVILQWYYIMNGVTDDYFTQGVNLKNENR